MIRYAVARWSLRARRGGNLTASLAPLEYKEMLRLLEHRGWKKAAVADSARIRRPPFPQRICPRRSCSSPISTSPLASAIIPHRIEQMSSLLRPIREALRSRKPSRA